MAVSDQKVRLDAPILEGFSYSYSQAISDLVSYCSLYSIELSDKQALDLVTELHLMLKKNKGVNLTSIREPEKALILHHVDSLLFLPVIQRVLNGSLESVRILDMGTGGGFPGIPLALVSNASYVLADSVNKKIKACREFSESLGVSSRVSCVHGRLEDLARESSLNSSFSCVVARALASLDILIEYATPFLSMGGFLVLSKGVPDAIEISNADSVSKICGLRLVSRETFELPHNYGHREFFVYEKVNSSKVRLPRKVGEAKNNPLAGK